MNLVDISSTPSPGTTARVSIGGPAIAGSMDRPTGFEVTASNRAATASCHFGDGDEQHSEQKLGGGLQVVVKQTISKRRFRYLIFIGCIALSQEGRALTPLLPSENNPYGVAQGRAYGRVVRTALSAEETQAVLPIGLELTLQSTDELQSRIDHGEVLTPKELEKYLPTQADYNATKTWLQSQGFTVTLESNLRHAIFVKGTVQQCATAFNTTFGRVATTDGEFTSALTEPSLPNDLAPIVRAIHGLQPHLKRYHSSITLTPAAVPSGFLSAPTIPAYYNAPSNLDGTGQTIAIIADSIPLSTDLTQYWSMCGLSRTLSSFTVVNISGGPGTVNTNQNEASLDVETASGIAPGAAIRLYATSCPLNSATEDMAATQILNDLPNCPGIHTISESYGGPGEGTAGINSTKLLAAQGVTYFSCSGDYGSNPNWTKGRYDSTQPLGVNYPASDLNVTGVGGTGLAINPGIPTPPEVGWSTVNGSGLASGGGISSFYNRPSWQKGTGVPAGTMRCVPDVAAMAWNGTQTSSTSSNAGGEAPIIIINGLNSGMGGTSLATPIWAGLNAIINQALAANGYSPTGNLNAKIYPLIGTNAFNDITDGNNGAYQCTAGYDLVTGIGSPNVANLIAALEAGPPGLSVRVTQGLPSTTVANGSTPITLQTLATGDPTGYQWYLNGSAIAGATNDTLTIYSTAASEGIYTVTATNANGSASASAGTLSITTSAWLENLSARAYSQPGANQLIAGFVTTGPNQKQILVRGDGPALTAFGLTGVLTDPQLTLVSGATTLATTTTWSSTLIPTFTKLGAFALTAGSHDTALLQSLAPGAYTAQVVSVTTNSGVALAEVYDADSGAPTNRLVNLSARAFVGTGANVLIGGFVIAGSTPQTVIIRGDGPALQQFGLSGALQSPVLTLNNALGTIATNTGWGNAPAIGSAATNAIIIQAPTNLLFAKVGAFLLADNSGDSAIVATLPPGAYTAQVAGSNSTTGIALVEVYELR
jgi:kumamolisin